MLPGRRGSSESPRCLVPGGDGERLRMPADAVTPAGCPPQGGGRCGPRGASLVGAERSSCTSRIFRIPRSMQGESERARVLSSLRKDLEGERSPGRIGHPPAGNGRMGVTDSTAEQGLEADAPVKRISKGRLWQRSRSEGTSGTGGNGKGATATVTWCGCGRVEFFEGCEQRRGECIGTPADRVPVSYRRPGRFRNPVSGNAANPMTGSGMQQARDLSSGGSRRGGAKPRGRNGIPRQAASGPNRVGSNVDSGE
jgi:hypothetical protein